MRNGINLRLLLSGAACAALTAAAGAAAAADANTVDELVVTVSKRAENIQNVPASVSAVTGEKLADLNAAKLDDFAAYLPGLSVSSEGTPGQTTITLRGVAPVGPGATVGTYIDDTPVGSSTAYANGARFELDLLPYDLDRFEVLRGPQGTLYGASAMGGIVKYILKTPSPAAFSAHAGADLFDTRGSGSLGWGARGALNIPIARDRAAISISGFDQETAGYIDNVGTGVKDSNKVRQWGGRIAAFLQPTDNLTLKLNAMFQRIRSDDDADETLSVVPIASPDGAQLVTGAPLHGDLTQSTLIAQPFEKDVDYYSAAVNWDLGVATLVSASSYSHTRTRRTTDLSIYDGTIFPYLGPFAPGIAKDVVNLGLDKVTQEVRLQSPNGGRVEWLAGGYFTHENSTNVDLEHAFTLAGAPIGGLGPELWYGSLPTNYTEVAAFADLTFHLTDRFDVTAGGRYAHDTQNYVQISDGVFNGGAQSSVGGHSSEDTFTWMINPRLHLSEDAMIYGRVATGFRPGGPNAAIPGVPTPTTFEADKLINYEAGLKSTLLDHRLTFDLSAFWIDWTNIQLTTRVGAFSYLGNGGKATSKGFELESAYYPVDALRLGLNAAYTDATLDELTPGQFAATGYLVGYQLPNVPKWSGSVTADYHWSLDNGWTARLGGGLRYVGKKYDNPVGLGAQTFVMPSYAMIDLNAAIATDRWTLKVFARNLTDKRAFSSGQIWIDAKGVAAANQASIVDPRTIGIGLEVAF